MFGPQPSPYRPGDPYILQFRLSHMTSKDSMLLRLHWMTLDVMYADEVHWTSYPLSEIHRAWASHYIEIIRYCEYVKPCMADRVMRQCCQRQRNPSQYLRLDCKPCRGPNPTSYRVRYMHVNEFWKNATSHAFVDSEDGVPLWAVDNDYMDCSATDLEEDGTVGGRPLPQEPDVRPSRPRKPLDDRPLRPREPLEELVLFKP
ncbi:hypothetical protein M9H77_21400 [Catharanthus roseus]|uniref:Uncharacterized protein n=1 Tax=Catharanthus roseus TaxID=4058 RepID=A0ACC0ANQ2_CATRO|nr:hypothetical protein M9H77_21400 [Catharanthus roseus]